MSHPPQTLTRNFMGPERTVPTFTGQRISPYSTTPGLLQQQHPSQPQFPLQRHHSYPGGFIPSDNVTIDASRTPGISQGTEWSENNLLDGNSQWDMATIFSQIEDICREAELDDDSKKKVHTYAELPLGMQLTALMAQTLAAQSKLQTITTRYEDTINVIKDTRDFMASHWKPTDVQEVIFKKLLRHLILTEALRYDNRVLVARACDYVAKHRSKYHLTAFATDEVIKTTVQNFFKDNIDNEKSKFRKMLVKYMKQNVDLDKLTAVLVDGFWTKDKRPSKPYSLDLLATVALKRQIAKDSTGRGNGSDTKFWKTLDRKLNELATKEEYGMDLTGGKWKMWKEGIVAKDRSLYKHTSVGNSITSDQEEEEDEDEDEEENATAVPASTTLTPAVVPAAAPSSQPSDEPMLEVSGTDNEPASAAMNTAGTDGREHA